MAEKTTYTHLPDEPCLTQEQIFRYIDGKLSPGEMYAVEKHLLDCAFCSDAMEGLQLTKERPKVAAFVPFDTKKEEHDEEKKPVVIPLFQRASTWYAVAASLVLLIGVGTVMKFSMSSPDQAESADHVLAQNDPKKEASGDYRRADSISTGNMDASNRYIPDTQKQLENKDQLARSSGASSAAGSADLDPVAPPSEQLNDLSISEDETAPQGPKTAVAKEAAPDVMQEKSKVEGQTVTRAEVQSTETTVADKVDGKQKQDDDKESDVNQQGGGKKNEDARNDQPATANSYFQTMPQQAAGSATQDHYVPAQAVQDSTVSDRIYKNKPTDEELSVSYDTGVQLLESGQASAALAFFDEVLQNTAHVHFEDAQWKKAEALIKLNRKDEARTLLNEIVSKGGKYKQQATEKLKTL